MSSLFDENRKFYVCGDFSIWAEDDTDNYTKRFLEVVGNFNYKNVVCEPTARSGHILDLVMCDELDDDLVEVYVDPDYMAQNFHKLVNFRIKTNTENKIVKKITFRRKNLFDEDILIEHGLQNIEIRKLLNCQCQGENCEERLTNNDCVHCLTLIFQEYEEPVYSYSTHPVRRSPRDIHNILKLSPPFASSEGVGGNRYQSDSAHRTQPTPPRHCLSSRCRV